MIVALWNLINGGDPNNDAPIKSCLTFEGTQLEFAAEGKNFWDLDLKELRSDLSDWSVTPIGCFETGRWTYIYASRIHGFLFQNDDNFYVLGFDKNHNQIQDMLNNNLDTLNQVIHPYDESNVEEDHDMLSEIKRLEQECDRLNEEIEELLKNKNKN